MADNGKKEISRVELTAEWKKAVQTIFADMSPETDLNDPVVDKAIDELVGSVVDLYEKEMFPKIGIELK